MRIAIVGAGFCGLATAWYLLKSFPSSFSLTLFDARGIGGGASGIAAGLLHPYAGAHAKLNRMGKEGMQATFELLQIASKALQKPVAVEQGILRPALTEDQKEDFLLCQAKHPEDVAWLETEDCLKLYPNLTPAPGLWIKHGLVVNSSLYLQGLWKACEERGTLLETKKITKWSELEGFDLQIVASGAQSLSFLEHSHFTLSTVKGQVLELEWPHDLPPLSFALNSQAYLLMNENLQTCLAGATFERDYPFIGPDIERAKADILPKAIAMIPRLKSARVINCYAGLRSVTPNHLPLVEQIDKGKWIITGMGSKGLLYHALTAKQLVEKISNR